jgi:hypothetical protein
VCNHSAFGSAARYCGRVASAADTLYRIDNGERPTADWVVPVDYFIALDIEWAIIKSGVMPPKDEVGVVVLVRVVETVLSKPTN